MIIRKFDPSTDADILEFEEGGTIVHIGSVAMMPLFSKEDFLRKFGTKGFYLAVEGKTVVGAILVAVEQEESSRFALIYGIKVDEPWRRQGIGFQLMRQADVFMEEAGLDRIVLDTRPDNTPALSLFRKCGFVIARKSRESLRLEKVNFCRRPASVSKIRRPSPCLPLTGTNTGL